MWTRSTPNTSNVCICFFHCYYYGSLFPVSVWYRIPQIDLEMILVIVQAPTSNALYMVSCPVSTAPPPTMVWSSSRQSQTLKSVNSHRDGRCPGHDPHNCHHFLMSTISKVATVTRIAGVMVTIVVAVNVFPVADVKRSQKVPTVTRMARVPITILVSVSISDLANLESANAHKDGGLSQSRSANCHDPRQKTNYLEDGACPPTTQTTGKWGKI